MGRKAAPKGAQKSQKAASQISAASPISADSQNVADSQQDLAGVNSEHYSRVQAALATIESIPELTDIKDLPPCRLTDGAAMEPYSHKIFERKLGLQEEYLCGHNLFLTNPLRDASPGFDCVPIS